MGEGSAAVEDLEFQEYKPAIVDGLVLEPVQAHVIFRHGDRSPSPFVHKDSQRWAARLQDSSELVEELNYHAQEYPWGWLTRKGAKQARELGSWLRNNYLEPLKLSPDHSSAIRVRSTNFRRTHMTAWHVLEGLLASSTAAASVPIIVLPEEKETLYNNEKCARLQKLWRSRWKSLNTPEAKGLNEGPKEVHWQMRYEGLKKALQRHFELPADAPLFPWALAIDVVNCGRFHGDPLPEGVMPTDVHEVVNCFAMDYVSSFQNEEVCQLSMGRLFRDIMDSILKVRDQPAATPRLLLYSGHDVTIIPVSVCLGSPWKTWPHYVSFIVWELLKKPNTDEFYVRVLYNGQDEALSVYDGSQAPPPSGNYKKNIFTLHEFQEHVGWCHISDVGFLTQCSLISDL